MQQEQRGRSQRANEKRLGGGVGVYRRSDSDKDRKVECDSAGHGGIVDFLLAVPPDRLVTDAHRYCPQCNCGFGGVGSRRESTAAVNNTGRSTASASQIR